MSSQLQPLLNEQNDSGSFYKQDKRPRRGDGDRGQCGGQTSGRGGGGGRVKVYLHAVTDKQAALLKNTETRRPVLEIKKKSGADVQFDPNPSPVPGVKIVSIRAVPSQIEAAVKLISEMTGAQGTMSEQAQTYWQQWVKATFPDLDSQPYFLPPVHFNRLRMSRQTVAGQDVLVLPSPHLPEAGQSSQAAVTSSTAQVSPSTDSDVRADAALQRVLCCLQKMSELQGEVLVGVSQLQFEQYLAEPCYAAAAGQLPRPDNIPSAIPHAGKRGDLDVLLIHRLYGIVVCEVKSFGDNVKTLNMSHQDVENYIRKKLIKAISQLDKAEAMLSHLVSDVIPGLRITKTIALPNVTACQVQQAISGDTQLSEELCRCLETTDPADITGLCLCSDQLSDPKTPWDVSSDVLRELGNWWQRRVAVSGADSHVTDDLYETLVARFGGPATTVTVPCISPPRLCVKTLGQAVSWTGDCYTAQITLFPEQVYLINTARPRLFLAGPPGTGKTVVLLLMGIVWLRCGNEVYIVSTCQESRAACSMLYHLLLQIVNTQVSGVTSPGQPHLQQYDMYDDAAAENALNVLSRAARGTTLHVIADEAGPEHGTQNFQTFCDKLLSEVPDLHLWAASCCQRHAPGGWQVESLTRPLRFPPAVLRDVQTAWEILREVVGKYNERGVADNTDGPSVRQLHHQGQGHSAYEAIDCVTCAGEVASFLHSLRPGVAVNTGTPSGGATHSEATSPARLQWRDVLVLYWKDVSAASGMVSGLTQAGIPVRVMTDDDIEDVATARSDVVWVAGGGRVHGLERKVVVVYMEHQDVNERLRLLSRCASQLVVVAC